MKYKVKKNAKMDITMLLKNNNNSNNNNLLHRINSTPDKGTIKDQTIKPRIEWILVQSPAHVPPEQKGER